MASTSRLRAVVLSALTICAFGCASIAIGQDANWDLRNYHRYNPWALLDGRLTIDLAAAGMPTYFNPLLDLPYAWLSQMLAPRAVAFAMGAWHGTSVLLLYAIARAVLPEADRGKAATLALIGCLGSAFVSELGNTMGDDTTVPFLLAALALVLHAGLAARPTRFALAGLVAGLAIGLKLTNAPYGLALATATFLVRRQRAPRLVPALALTSGIVVGIAITYGWWGVALASHFGNPFFPQFNALFGAPLAAATGIVDDKWFPADFVEALLFPLVFTLFPMRVHEVPLANPLWPPVYLATVAWIAITAAKGRRRDADAGADTFVLLFAIVAYVAWACVFSIGRYLIALETLLPLLTWVLLRRLLPRRGATTATGLALAIAAATPFVHFQNWGTAPFAEAAVRVEVPAIDDPAHATVLVLTAPVAWTFPAFPREVAFVGRNSSFPESPAYRATVDRLVKARGGPVYAVLPADTDERESGLSRMNALFARHDVHRDDLPCRYARAALSHAPASDVVSDDTADEACRFRRDRDRHPLSIRDPDSVADEIAKEGIRIEPATCPTFRAWIGAAPFDYRFCAVTRD